MTEKPTPQPDPVQPVTYQIRIHGHLDTQWTDWFEGLTITLEEDGDTLLTGPVIDQSALHGLLKKVRDLGMPLVSVVPIQFDSMKHIHPVQKGEKMNISKTIAGFSPKVNMNSARRVAVITGVIFIIATVINLIAAALTSFPADTDYLTWFSAHPNQVAGGALLYLISFFASGAIPIAMYPVLKERNVGLALGSVVFRALEAAFYMVGLVSLLSLLTLSRQFTAAGADRTTLQTIGNLLVSIREWAALVAVFAFCLGAFLYYTLFFQTRLVPRWLSGFGIVAIILMLTACVLSLFSGNPITSYIPLVFPIFLQEMVLAVWLIAKGFNPSITSVLPTEDEMNSEKK